MTTYTADTPILDGPVVDAGVLAAALVRRNTHKAAEIYRITSAYDALGTLFGTGNLFPFAQAWHETSAFTSDRWRKSFNPAGLGATNDGAWGGHFASEAHGIAAQLAHLLAYAGADAWPPPGLVLAGPRPQTYVLNAPQRVLVALDPRLAAVTAKGWRGVAPTWLGLNGRWAVPGAFYAQRIAALASQLAP